MLSISTRRKRVQKSANPFRVHGKSGMKTRQIYKNPHLGVKHACRFVGSPIELPWTWTISDKKLFSGLFLWTRNNSQCCFYMSLCRLYGTGLHKQLIYNYADKGTTFFVPVQIFLSTLYPQLSTALNTQHSTLNSPLSTRDLLGLSVWD